MRLFGPAGLSKTHSLRYNQAVPKRKTKKAETEEECDSEACAKESDNKSAADDLRPFDQKFGESSDNLKRRSDWFEKRRGGS